ncbi:DUF1463 family protein (plasmid) [Borrelia miyamotoi]|nr:DUF1463 family protein [Borrelia miyamotoi]
MQINKNEKILNLIFNNRITKKIISNNDAFT